MNRFLTITLLSSMLLLPACTKRTMSEVETFPVTQDDYVLAFVIDLSSSFAQELQSDNASAYQFLFKVIDKYRRDRAGSQNDRLIIAQLSTGDTPLLWEGRPDQLGKVFASQQEFSDFLRSNATPGGSHVYSAIDKTLSYLLKRPRTTLDTKLVTIVLSDLIDNDADDSAKANMIETLRTYSSRGLLGMYWVDQTVTNEWNDIFTQVGYEAPVWSSIVTEPELPQFDDFLP